MAEPRMKLCIAVLCFCLLTSLFAQCDARRHFKASEQQQRSRYRTPSALKISKNVTPLKHLNINPTLLDESSAVPPSSFPPFDDTIGPISPSYLPLQQPPFCVYPPFTPLPPFTPIINAPPPPPSYTYPIQNPPPSPPSFGPSPPEYGPSPPEYVPSPPEIMPGPPTYIPSPPEFVPGPPTHVPSPPEFVPGPPVYVPSPPEFEPSPPEYVPGPPLFLPPIVYPPPAVPQPPSTGTRLTLWCVAKPTVPDPIIQEAMNYACGSGADCGSIQPDGSCYKPDTLYAHASFAFNSYWQRTKAAGGTCDFGGTAMLVTRDPSFDGCHFILY